MISRYLILVLLLSVLTGVNSKFQHGVLVPTVIGDECIEHAQCAEMNAVCLDDGSGANRCLCDPDSSVGDVRDPYCLAIASAVGENCEDSRQCEPLQAECVEVDPGNRQCLCTGDFVGEPGDLKCLRKADAVGDMCESSSQCSHMNATCDPTNKCACLPGFVPHPSGRTCIKPEEDPGLGDPCTASIQCSNALGLYSHCDSDSKTCQCIPNAVPNSENIRCYPKVDYIGHPCDIRRQCVSGKPGSLSDCVAEEEEEGEQKRCQCNYNAIHDPGFGSDRCFEKRHYLNDPCDVDSQCVVSLGQLSHCSEDGVCKCRENISMANEVGTACVSIE